MRWLSLDVAKSAFVSKNHRKVTGFTGSGKTLCTKAAEKSSCVKGTAFRPYITTLESARL
jgi:hypothetical protein